MKKIPFADDEQWVCRPITKFPEMNGYGCKAASEPVRANGLSPNADSLSADITDSTDEFILHGLSQEKQPVSPLGRSKVHAFSF